MKLIVNCRYANRGAAVKKDIHPELYDVTITCACGASVQTRSTSQEIKPTLCSQCHPFFTGEQRFVDTMGRIERFEQKFKKFKKDKKGAKKS